MESILCSKANEIHCINSHLQRN
uniref:Uncharacterized protein n=1 Tax=Tetranychus urticae TaxID=32264 RepID=T1KFJ0_TETUR